MKYKWTMSGPLSSLPHRQMAMDIIALPKDGFLKEQNTLIEIIAAVSKEIDWTTQNQTQFIYDLLCTVQHVEDLGDKTYQSNLRYTLETMFHTPEQVLTSVSSSFLKHLLINKWVPAFELHNDKSVILNRVYERLYAKIELDENALNSRINDNNDRIVCISKLKAQLTLCIIWLCENATIGDDSMNQDVISIWNKICNGLLYFKTYQKYYDCLWKLYQRSLHIWFLKQCCVYKGFHWTQMFLTQPAVQRQFQSSDLTDVISKFRHQADIEWFINTFNNDFGDRYRIFKKYLSSGNIDASWAYENQHFACLLTTALCLFNFSNFSEICSAICRNRLVCKTANKNIEIREYLLNCRQITSEVESNCIRNLLPIPTQKGKIFFSSSCKDPTREILARLCFHWFSALQIAGKNPFKLLLLHPEKFETVSAPGRASQQKVKHISTFVLGYCSNGHNSFLSSRQYFETAARCGDPWCNQIIAEASANESKATELDSTMENKEEREKEIKEVSPVICTLLQLLNFLTLLLRDVSCANGCPKLEKILKIQMDDITPYLWKSAHAKFKRLSRIIELNDEQLCVALHCWISKFPQWLNEEYPDQFEKNDFYDILDFEMRVESHYATFFNKFKHLYDDIQLPTNSNEMHKILYDMKENNNTDNSFKKQYIPHLFLITHRLSVSKLTNQFYYDPELQNRYPLLFHTLKWIDKLGCVKLLPSIAQWIKYCYTQYSGKLTKYQAKRKYVCDVIQNSCKDNDLSQLWKAFTKYWTVFARETLETKLDPVNMPLPSDIQKCTIAYSVARPEKQYFTIVAMIEMSQAIQNVFLQKFKLWSNQEENKMEENDICSNKVVSKSLFDITPLDVISIDKKTLNTIIQSYYCPTLKYGNKTAEQQIDFQSIENEIYHRAIRGRHKIDISIPMFEFADELTIEHCLEMLERCHPNVRDTNFDANEVEAVQNLLNDPHQKQHAFEILSQLVVLLSHDIQNIDLNEEICNWMKSMNFDEKDYNLFKEKNNGLLVKHVGDLWRAFNYTGLQLE
ncbi:hypothetical protein RFI_34426 [Reticulomyxa filosa]|uniref:Uncharacterized protein n=1 Tax=Reticulomyxa filosa TaxID=46433 RepID=X6LM29_RETFI|nr:hypothetical protein RFI_34426 [Reticulomyxa filosa]|eukprot:ETO02983.1 hypothetical protein RFI_34426 [Reticulomyxa filosa]